MTGHGLLGVTIVLLALVEGFLLSQLLVHRRIHRRQLTVQVPPMEGAEVDQVTLREGAADGAQILLRWSCGCTERATWATGLVIEHVLATHRTTYLDRTHREAAMPSPSPADVTVPPTEHCTPTRPCEACRTTLATRYAEDSPR